MTLDDDDELPRYDYAKLAAQLLGARGLVKNDPLPTPGKYPVRSWACALCREWHDVLLEYRVRVEVPALANVEPADDGLCRYCHADTDGVAEFVQQRGADDYARDPANYTPKALAAYLYREYGPTA